MKVSIGLPCYNAAKTLAWAVQSILNQTHKDFVLFVINDGSTDPKALFTGIINKVAQQSNMNTSGTKIPPGIIDDIKKLNPAQRKLLGQVLLGQTKVTA